MEQAKQPQYSTSSPIDSQAASKTREQYFSKDADYLEPELKKKLCLTKSIQQINQKIDKVSQESILKSIENTNIQRIVSEAMSKFNPPYCGSCPSRRADRVCMNKACGNAFMQLICGKCHYEKHKNSVIKPEIDIEEYFAKLATFLNTNEHSNSKNTNKQLRYQQPRIDKDTLSTAIDRIKDIRQELEIIKEKLLKEQREYVLTEKMVSNLQDSITKALSLCEMDNIAEQLNQIKHNIIFEKNGFQWNNADKKQVQWAHNIDNLNLNSELILKIISKSIIGGTRIDLTKVECQYGKTVSLATSRPIGSTDFQITDDGEITMINPLGHTQVFINYQLNPQSKYRLIFKFNNHPSQYVIIGVFPLSQVQAQFQCSLARHYFLKRFKCPDALKECSRILKGSDLSYNDCFTGQKIEIQVDFENNYMEFSDFPEHKNVNANIQTYNLLKEPYVFTFSLDKTSSITVESLEEIYSLDDSYLKETSNKKIQRKLSFCSLI